MTNQPSAAFHWLQLASATACVALSAARLARQDIGDAVDAAWEWEVSHGRLLERVAAECGLAGGAPGIVAIRRFFYDAYSCCIDGSFFDGLRMDLVSFAEELILGGGIEGSGAGRGGSTEARATGPAAAQRASRSGPGARSSAGRRQALGAAGEGAVGPTRGTRRHAAGQARRASRPISIRRPRAVEACGRPVSTPVEALQYIN
ncbi:hypothetical protein ACP70R_007016 [Stipagrostis hirtigluma subsp. patula]